MTTSASVFSSRFLAVSASETRAAKRPQERSGTVRVSPYRRFSPRNVELEPRRTSHGRGRRGSFIRVRRTDDGALDQRCDRWPGHRGRGRTAAQTLDGFRIVAPGIAGAGGALLASQGRRRVPQGQSAPPAGELTLCRGLIIDCGLGKLGQAFVGFLLFSQGLLEQLRGLRIVQLERPCLQGAVA